MEEEGVLDPASSRAARLKSFLFKPWGPSGHSSFRKGRFALSLFSMFHIWTVVGSAKDIYLEKMGADPTTVAIIWTGVSIWGVGTAFLHGIMQDRQLLSSCFPVALWGRRAPWFMTHGVIAAIAAALVYVPDLFSKSVVSLHVWFTVTVVVAFWGAGSCVTAFETARQEVYPFKEERIFVEGLCKYAAMQGGGTGGFPFLVLAAFDSLELRILLSFAYILPCSLASLEAVPLLREAKSPGTDSLRATLGVLMDALPFRKKSNRALQHLMGMAFWDAAYGSWIASVLLYYITYVLQPSSAPARTFMLVVSGFAAGTTESLLNIVYMRVFGAGDARKDKSGEADKRLLNFVVFMRVLNAAVTVAIMGIATPSIAFFILWCVTCRCGVCGFTFWRVSAKCWLVDEDAVGRAQDGKRQQANSREGTIFGTIALTRNIAGAIWSSLAMFGLSYFGLKTTNCSDVCEMFTGDSHGTCMDECWTHIIEDQPDSLRFYCRFVIGFIAPLCELLLAFHAYAFPIKGTRLRRLYHTVMEDQGDLSYLEAPDGGPPAADMDMIVSKTTAHAATSKIGLVAESIDDISQPKWQEQLKSTVVSIDNRDCPKSCAVMIEVLDELSRPSSTRSGSEHKAMSNGIACLHNNEKLLNLEEWSDDLPDVLEDTPVTLHEEGPSETNACLRPALLSSSEVDFAPACIDTTTALLQSSGDASAPQSDLKVDL